jgi:hypothetical protein
VLKNKHLTIIIAKKKKWREDLNTKPHFCLLEIIVTENIYKISHGKIRFKLVNKMSLRITDDSRIMDEIDEKEETFNFVHICSKFVIIDTMYKVVLCDYLNNLHSTIFTKTTERSIEIFYSYDELIGKESRVINRSYIFGFSQNREIYYFTIEDNSFDSNEDLKCLNIIMKRLKLDRTGEKIRDFKVVKVYSQFGKTWYYLICYLKDREFVYFVSEYLQCSFQQILEKIYSNDPEVEKNSILMKESKFSIKKIFDFYNPTGVCALVIANGDNLILMEYEANFTPNKMRILLSNGNLDSRRKSISPNLTSRPNSTRENNLISEDNHIKYFAFSLQQYNVLYYA